jgi:hypothetical protein
MLIYVYSFGFYLYLYKNTLFGQLNMFKNVAKHRKKWASSIFVLACGRLHESAQPPQRQLWPDPLRVDVINGSPQQ